MFTAEGKSVLFGWKPKKTSQKNEDPILYSPKISYAFPQNISASPRRWRAVASC
jgi:hypothetical protein